MNGADVLEYAADHLERRASFADVEGKLEVAEALYEVRAAFLAAHADLVEAPALERRPLWKRVLRACV